MKINVLHYVWVLTSVVCVAGLNAEIAEWTMLTIMQADNNLAPFALQNIMDMQKNMVGNKVNKLVYWHKPRSNQRWKCKIKSNGTIEEEVIEIKTAPNMEREIIDAMYWAVSTNPAKHYMLNLWDHGTGIIDHSHWSTKHKNTFRFFREGSWLEVPGLNYEDRGILYSDSTKTFLNNQQLTSACRYIKQNIIKKNIDIIGMDACLMAMLEVAYQIRDSASYLVSSQNLEPGRGWNYGSFLRPISTIPTAYSPLKVGQAIVDTYAQYYTGKCGFYTLSVIDLGLIDELKKNLDNIITAINNIKKTDAQGILGMVKYAALTAIKFDGAEFIDLYSFYNNLLKGFGQLLAEKKKDKKIPDAEVLALQFSLNNGLQFISRVVPVNKVGAQFGQARGISIYYPHGAFHQSYTKTLFMQDSSWASLVLEANVQRINKYGKCV